MELSNRKNLRLKSYDYSLSGMYFVTICTHMREYVLGQIVVGEGFHPLPSVMLTRMGEEVSCAIAFADEKYGCIDKYVIMPNHVHMIVDLTGADRDGTLSLQDIIGRLKSFTTYKYNLGSSEKTKSLWQRSYHDHIIRNHQEYLEIWQYIENNPAQWELDQYYEKLK